jgi:hypothetical protein
LGYTGSQGVIGYTGSQGVIGYTGSQGVIGYTGSQGIQGVIGYTGSRGYSGSQGIQGVIGYTGSKGDQGVIGYTGSQGIQGVIGYTGSKGDQGVIGYTGSQGIQGVIGYTGSQGVIGYTGSQGVIGYTGSQGVIGYTGSQGVIGYSGSRGSDGNFGGATFDYTFDNGVAAADPGTGKLRFNNATLASANALYIDAANDAATDITTFLNTIDDSSSTIKGHFRVSKKFDPATFALFTISSLTNNTSWFSVVCSYVSGNGTFANTDDIIITFARTGDRGDIGYTGSQGIQGVIGYTGSQGVIGYTGSQGIQGVIGYTGSRGYTGSQGIQGVIGYTGSQGIQGVIGYTGSQGIQGVIGYTGSKGDQGVIGYTGSQGIQGVIGYTGSQGVIGYTGSQGVIGYTGSQGVIGYTGSQGDRGGVPFLFSTTVTDADPGNGIFRYNSATIASVTFIYIDNLDALGNTQSTWFDSWDDSSNNAVKGLITMTSATAAGTSVNIFRITGAVTVATGYYKIPVTYVSGALPTNNAAMSFSFSRVGDQGYTGSQGVIGYTGSQGVIGYTGSQGVIGYTGSQGVIGYTGSQGVIGYTGSRGYTGSQGVIGYTGSQGVIGYTGSQGIQGVIGYTGSQGNLGGAPYVFSTTVTDADPGNGAVRYNNAAIASVTFIYIDNLDNFGNTQTTWYDTWDDSTNTLKGFLTIMSAASGSTTVNVFRITGTVTVAAGYYKIPVTYVSGALPTNTAVMTVTFARAGDLGYTGSQGVIGYTGSQGVIGYTGSQGVIGYTGSQGVIGYTGSQGVIGYTGSRGYTGSQGVIGYTGSQGVIGYTGSTGFRAQTQSTAPTGSNTGDIWFDTETGMIKIYYNDGDSAQWVTATGTRGNLGYSGSRGYTGSSGLPTWSLKTANYTAQSLDYILADTTAGTFTITLPASPVLGSTVTILDKYNWAINNLIVARNGSTIEGIADDFIIDIGQARIEFTYDGTTWQIYSSIGSKGYTGSSGSSNEAIAYAIALG